MPAPQTVSGDLACTGTFTPKAVNYPALGISNNAIQAGAVGSPGTPGRFIDPTKLLQIYSKVVAQESATASVSESRVIHAVAGQNATVFSFRAGNVVANVGAAVVTVDLKKNGASVLSAPITLNSSTPVRTPQFATVTTLTAVLGDVFEITIVATVGSGTLAKGVYASLLIEEEPL